MFGIGFYAAYGNYVFDFLGGTNAALLVALVTRLMVGVAWFLMFRRANISNPYLAFVPFIGCYKAFRMVWDDFSLAVLFAATTFVAFVHAVGIDQTIVNACAVINFIFWWIMALLTSYCFRTNMLVGFLYGGVPWLGAILLALWPSASYRGPWSSDPQAEQNLSPQERKKLRKKQAKEAKKAK